MKPIRVVLLDMGGVILTMGNAWGLPQANVDWRGREALLARVSASGGRSDEEELESLLFGPWRADYERRYQTLQEAPWEPHLERFRAAAGCSASGLELLHAWFRPYAETLEPAPRARETLAALVGSGRELALISNVPAPGSLYRQRLEKHGLTGFFRSLRFSYDEGSRKPSPAMLTATLAELSATPDETVMVGDRRASDIAAGRAAGTRTVWLRSRDGGGPDPDGVVEELAELVSAVDRWGRP